MLPNREVGSEEGDESVQVGVGRAERKRMGYSEREKGEVGYGKRVCMGVGARQRGAR